MKKKFLFYAVMILGSLLVSCSSDDGYSSYEETEDAKLQYTKNLILSYGQKYGLENIQFDDELLKKNLNLPKEEFEKCVIDMAISMGKLKASPKILRKMRRASIGGEEPIGPGDEPTIPHYKADGYFSESESKNGVDLNYTMHYYFESLGIKHLEVETANAEKVIKDSSGNVVSVLSSEGNFDTPKTDAYIVSFTIGGEAKAHYTIKYNVNIYSNSPTLSYSFAITNKMVSGDTDATKF